MTITQHIVPALVMGGLFGVYGLRAARAAKRDSAVSGYEAVPLTQPLPATATGRPDVDASYHVATQEPAMAWVLGKCFRNTRFSHGPGFISSVTAAMSRSSCVARAPPQWRRPCRTPSRW